MKISEMQKKIYQNKVNKGFNITDVPKEFCLIYGEVGEAYEAYRKKKDDLGEELADIVIYVMGVSEILNVNLEEEIIRKIDKNKDRFYYRVNGVLKKEESGKRISARAIIVENNELYITYRRKKENNEVSEYYVLPGGGVENKETLEEACIRETKEETNLDIEIIKYVGEWENETTHQYFYLCKYLGGTPKVGDQEINKSNEDNYYEIVKYPLDKIDEITTFHKEVIIKTLKDNGHLTK